MDDLDDELSEAHHLIVLLQNKLNKKEKDIKLLTPLQINKVCTENNNKKGIRDMWQNSVTQLFCEILFHYTTPPCMSANILSQAQTTHPTSTFHLSCFCLQSITYLLVM